MDKTELGVGKETLPKLSKYALLSVDKRTRRTNSVLKPVNLETHLSEKFGLRAINRKPS